jgi:hypothetical protein
MGNQSRLDGEKQVGLGVLLRDAWTQLRVLVRFKHRHDVNSMLALALPKPD